MLVSDVLTIERHDLGLPPQANDEAEQMSDRLMVAEAMTEVFRAVQPKAGRHTAVLSNVQDLKLPYPMLTVGAMFLDGSDITSYRVLPQQMSVE